MLAAPKLGKMPQGGICRLKDKGRQVACADEIGLGHRHGGALVPDGLARGDGGQAHQYMRPVLNLGPFDVQHHAFA